MASNRFEDQPELQIKLMRAAKEVREAFGDNQAVFGQSRLAGKSLSAVNRMENEKFPLRDLRTLTKMASLAREVGREDLATIFREQLLIAGGSDLLPEQPAEGDDPPEVAAAIRKLRYIYKHGDLALRQHLEESMRLIEYEVRRKAKPQKR